MDQRFAVAGVEAFTALAEAAPALLLAKAEPLFVLEAAARGGADMDAVHDMRVASRRLRETMRLLEPLYPGPAYREWYRRVRRVTGALGPVRDSDVFIDDFSRLGKDLGEGGRRTVAFLVGYRMGVREQQLRQLDRELSRLDLAKSKRELRRVARSIGTSEEGARPLAHYAHAAIAERAATVFGALPDALLEENIEQQHALRIDFKRLRYAVEVFAPVYAEDFDVLHDTLTAFQDTLGDLHDLHLFIDMLQEPERVESASRAGVSAADVGEVVALLQDRATQTFAKFARLAAEHPAGELLGELLLPLSRRPAPPVPAEPVAEQPAVELEVVVDPAGNSSASELAPAAPAPAVVLEPAAPIAEGVPQLDPSRPWSSDAAGLSIDPPIVIGAEPWARPVVPAEVVAPDAESRSTGSPVASDGPGDDAPALAAAGDEEAR